MQTQLQWAHRLSFGGVKLLLLANAVLVGLGVCWQF